jgi:hypothetical protein
MRNLLLRYIATSRDPHNINLGSIEVFNNFRTYDHLTTQIRLSYEELTA